VEWLECRFFSENAYMNSEVRITPRLIDKQLLFSIFTTACFRWEKRLVSNEVSFELHVSSYSWRSYSYEEDLPCIIKGNRIPTLMVLINGCARSDTDLALIM
jgi:hypothetical protein